MDLKQSCNVFLPVKQYEEIRDLSHRLSIPYSELIREGVRLVLKRHKRKNKRKDKRCKT
jgi:hypothetical protein